MQDLKQNIDYYNFLGSSSEEANKIYAIEENRIEKLTFNLQGLVSKETVYEYSESNLKHIKLLKNGKIIVASSTNVLYLHKPDRIDSVRFKSDNENDDPDKKVKSKSKTVREFVE